MICHFGLFSFALWTALSGSQTGQNWLDCVVSVCPTLKTVGGNYLYLQSSVPVALTLCIYS